MRDFAVAVFVAMCAHTAQAQSTEAIDRLFAGFDGEVPSASVGVIKDGELVFAKSYGLRQLEGTVMASPTTNYRLASLSKAFTAMAIVILAERDLIDLEAPITDYLEFPAYGRTIKVRHLLNHQSGLVDYEDLIPSSQTEQVSDADVVDLLRRQRSTYFTPGSQYRYSNGGYAMLAEIVVAVSGTPFQGFLASEIFEPLAMRATVAFVDGTNSVSERAYGYTRSGSAFAFTDQSITSAVLGDGGVYSSISDLVQWDQALYPGAGLVTDESLGRIFAPGRLNDGSVSGYGFGWVVDRYRGVQRIAHTGSTIGQRSAIQRFPSKRLTVIVLMNRANVAPWDYARELADMFW